MKTRRGIEFSSYRRLAWNAQHYYAKAWKNYNNSVTKAEIDRAINKYEAKYLNEKDGWDGWKEGDLTNRHDNEEEALWISILWWIEEAVEEGFIDELEIELGDHVYVSNFTLTKEDINLICAECGSHEQRTNILRNFITKYYDYGLED